MTKKRFVGLDVHAETIEVAVAEPNGEVRSIGSIANGLEVDSKIDWQAAPSPPAPSLL